MSFEEVIRVLSFIRYSILVSVLVFLLRVLLMAFHVCFGSLRDWVKMVW
jgi:hypothetical protein